MWTAGSSAPRRVRPGTAACTCPACGPRRSATCSPDTALDAQVIGDEIGQASAVKMAYAAWTKGTAALILAIRALARAEGVEQTLVAEWQQSQPALTARPHAAARSALQKGWRWVAEMEEIAATMAAAGLPPGFHQAAAAIYTRVPHTTTSAPTASPRSPQSSTRCWPSAPPPSRCGQPGPVHGRRACPARRSAGLTSTSARAPQPAGVSTPSGVPTDRPRAHRSRPGPGASSRAPGRSPPGRSASRSRR